jgi:hypothetical protein
MVEHCHMTSSIPSRIANYFLTVLIFYGQWKQPHYIFHTSIIVGGLGKTLTPSKRRIAKFMKQVRETTVEKGSDL